MKKYLIILFAVVMLLLAACQSPGNTGSDSNTTGAALSVPVVPTPLSDAQKQEIEAAWLDWDGWNKHDLGTWHENTNKDTKDGFYVRYYGTYGDCIVLFRRPLCTMDVVSSITIADETFNYPYPFQLFAYRDGEFAELKDAYANGLVTAEDISQIADLHRYIRGEVD